MFLRSIVMQQQVMQKQWRVPVTWRRPIMVSVVAMLLLPVSGCYLPTEELIDQGVEATKLQNYPRADQKLTQALEQSPSRAEALGAMGRLRLLQDRPFEAQLHLERALAVKPEHPQHQRWLNDLAEAIYRQNQPQALSRMLRQACNQYGSAGDFRRQGVYLMRIGDFDRAEVALKKYAHFAAPDQVEPFMLLADLYRRVGDKEQTAIALRHALWVDLSDEQVRNELRAMGIVPGPTVALEPDRDLIDEPSEQELIPSQDEGPQQ